MLGALRQSRRQALSSLSQLQLAAYKHSQGPVERSSDFQDGESLVGAYTPVTKKLWLQRYKWDDETLADATPSSVVVPKAPKRTVVSYRFTSDAFLREHYRNPWGNVRLGRVLEDLDSFAGFIAFEHCDDGNPATRPPLLATAAVEAIHFRNSRLQLTQDMQMCGQAVWTGRSSLDVLMEIAQGGQQQLAALFTFVARDPLSNRAQPINPLRPATPQEQRVFDERQRVAHERKAAREAQNGALHKGTPAQREWAAQLLQQGQTKAELPALADGRAILMPHTSLENTLISQPQERNLHGRVFGGFLMRRAFELAFSTAYLFAGTRPQTEEVGEIIFRKPVDVGDLIKFKSNVLAAWQSEEDPCRGCVHVQVQASVTQPEKLHSFVTNVFNFEFSFELQKDAQGQPVPPLKVLPTTEEAALEVAKWFGPGAKPSGGSGFLGLL